jgi:formylglycine-generating enzyme required for sulfatase activity
MGKTARDKIHELRALHDDGLLSQEEFDRRKNAILDAQLAPTNPLRVVAAPRAEQGTELSLGGGQEVGPPDKRYRLERLLGQGAMGQVWLATDLATHAELGHSDKVAVKILPPELTQSTLHAKLLIEEATRARKLAHENIVRVYEWAQDPATTSYFIIMEYLEGVDLDRHLGEHGTLSLEQIKMLLSPVAQALRYAWEKHQLVHRDLKPSNLLLTRQGEIKLLDFGIAARVKSSANTLAARNSGASTQSVLPANAGTAGYRAPEAGARQRQPEPQLDVYALAVMIYQMLEGELPFGQVRTPQQVPSAPKLLDERQWRILQQGFAFHPETRPRSALALMEALFEIELPGTAPPQARPAQVPPEVQERQKKQLIIQEQQKKQALQKAEEERKQREQQLRKIEEEQRKQLAVTRTQALRDQVLRLRQEEQQRQAFEAQLKQAEIERKKREQAQLIQKRMEEAEHQMRLKQAQVVPQAPGVEFRDRFLDKSSQGPLLVLLPSGVFLMGSNDVERETARLAGAHPAWLARETPQHWVEIDYAFAIGKYPITVGEWRQFAKATGWQDEAEANWQQPGFEQDDQHPVVCISWHDVQAYCVWLSQITGRQYRLPSEAEWEFACRAGTQSAFHFGDQINISLANYDANFTWNGGPKGEARRGTSKSGSFPANRWGLHDMHGNVWEWVQDVVHDNYQGAPQDGSVWQHGGDPERHMLRGGSWLYSPRYLRAASRNGYSASGRNDIVGARIVRVLDPDEAADMKLAAQGI